MRDDIKLNTKYRFVNANYIRQELNYHGADILRLKYVGILDPYTDKNTPFRSLYTLSSFLKLKEFVEKYKEEFGVKPSVGTCETFFKLNKEGK
jgi:hypothetical protein